MDRRSTGLTGCCAHPPRGYDTLLKVEMSSWLALLAPAGTPRAAIDHLNAATNTALQESQLREKIIDLGAVPEGGSPEDLAAFLHSEAQKWKRVIEIASVKID